MERRSALKNMGMVFGYAVATPTLLGIIQSCEKKPDYANWTPSFFTKDQGYAMAQTIDVILPKTDTPSATEMNVHVFIDEFSKNVLPKEHQDFMMLKMDKFFEAILKSSGKESLQDVKAEDIEPVLAKYLRKRSPEEEEAHFEVINNYMRAIEEGGEATIDDEVAKYSFANDLRNISTWGYKSSEYIGEEVLAYLPIPGEYVACGDLNELTQGKAWSL
ncbi:gluconate 2-dehydrogenase subunit 3 family protein [Flagellimonas onchidii]|uniref:gluconate 2-dehydrogenase subunit 3 family protein n=1 Tax=Flagellimonas onchidii TaxID=2562684 RepID=UPI0010A5E4E8|nr:gluconate 2-dehydrogenase subunit 3 family protein [Allomuricauda onchidii]